MLNRQFRLNLREENEFFLNCKKIHTPYFSFFYKPSETFKATVIVSKKNFGLATKRSVVKRKFRSALASILEDLIKFEINLAVVVHEKGAELSVSQISQQIKKNVQKIRI